MAQRPYIEAAHCFRLGYTAAGSEALATTVDALASILPKLGHRATAVVPIVERILAAQERGDSLAVADELEYELAPILDAFDGPSSVK
jgi:hypothetical protein